MSERKKFLEKMIDRGWVALRKSPPSIATKPQEGVVFSEPTTDNDFRKEGYELRRGNYGRRKRRGNHASNNRGPGLANFLDVRMWMQRYNGIRKVKK